MHESGASVQAELLPVEQGEVELSVVLPCLNEAETLEICVTKALAEIQRMGIRGEVVIADNGSTDGSQAIALRLGARVVDVPEKGYGAALLGGIRAARGTYVIMADADDSYALDDLQPFVDALRAGADLVMGNRFQGGIEPGAMPALHRYLGNPVLSWMGRAFFRTPIGDFHCGMRGFSRDAILGPGPADPRDGVRQRDGRPGIAGEAADLRGSDHAAQGRAHPATAPADLARRVATPAVPAGLQPPMALPLPRVADRRGEHGRPPVACRRAASGRRPPIRRPDDALPVRGSRGGAAGRLVLRDREGLRDQRWIAPTGSADSALAGPLHPRADAGCGWRPRPSWTRDHGVADRGVGAGRLRRSRRLPVSADRDPGRHDARGRLPDHLLQLPAQLGLHRASVDGVTADTIALDSGDPGDPPGDSRPLGPAAAVRRVLPTVLLAAVWVVATIASWSVRASVPPYPIFGSDKDDEMQVLLSHSIAGGQWLGPWSDTILSKGPGYPAFLVVAHDVGLNPMMAAQAVYLAGATLLALGVVALVRSRLLAGVLYVALAMNPAMFGAPSSRVYRESLTAALAILVLGLFVLLVWLVVRPMRLRWRVLALAPLALALGLAAAWLTQTRIDTAWILVTIAPIAVASVFWSATAWRERGLRALTLAGSAAVVLVVVLAVGDRVADLNEEYYGVRVTDDYSAGPFAEMSNVWASVQVGQPRTFVPISAAQREAVYAISPDAARMRPLLDGKKEYFGRSASCEVADVCDDYAGGWMPWGMRVAAGEFTQTAVEFQDFFGRIRDDITTACADGRLTCGAKGLGPGVPPLADIDRTVARENLSLVLESGYKGFAAAGLAGALHDDRRSRAARHVAAEREGHPQPPEQPHRMDRPGDRSPDHADPGAVREGRWVVPVAGAAGAPVGAGTLRADARRAGVIGLSAFAGCAAHAALLAVWSAGTGAPTGESFYLIASISFFVTGLVVGVWCVVDGVVALGRRAVLARRAQ